MANRVLCWGGGGTLGAILVMEMVHQHKSVLEILTFVCCTLAHKKTSTNIISFNPLLPTL